MTPVLEANVPRLHPASRILHECPLPMEGPVSAPGAAYRRALRPCQWGRCHRIPHGPQRRHVPSSANSAFAAGVSDQRWPRNGASRRTRQTSQDQGLLLRSAQSVAAPNQREYQWPRAAVPAKRRRSEPVFTPRSGKDRPQPQHKVPSLSRLSNFRGSVLQ